MSSLTTITAALNLNGAQFVSAINQAASSVSALTQAMAAQIAPITKTNSSIDAYLTRLERQALLAGKSAEEQIRLQKTFDVADYGKTAGAIIRINDAYDKLIENQQRLNSAVSDGAPQINLFAEHLASMAASGMRAGQALTSALTQPIMALAKEALRLGSSFEQAEIGFTTMLGSATDAKDFLNELKNFAAKTPFEFPELLQASKRMTALGFAAQDTIPVLRVVGDAVAGLGGGAPLIDRITLALGQMQAKGKVSAEEMRQLAEAGIPAWKALADSIGVKVPVAMKMAENGAISAAQAIPAILEGMNKKFAGLMDAQSKTISGQFSNTKDRITFILADLGKSLIPFAQSVMSVVDPMVGAIGKVAAAFARLPEPVKAFGIGILGIVAAIGPAIVAFSTFAALLAPIASALGTTGIMATLAGLVPILATVATGVVLLAGAFALMQIPAVKEAIMGLGTVLMEFWESTIKPGIEYVAAFGVVFGKAAASIISSGINDALQGVAKESKSLWERLKELVPATSDLSSKMRTFADLMGKAMLIRILGDLKVFELVLKAVGLAIEYTAKFISGQFSSAVEGATVLVKIAGAAWELFAKSTERMASALKTVAQPAIDIVGKKIQELWNLILMLPGSKQIVESMGGSFEGLKNKLAAYGKGIDASVQAQLTLWKGTEKVATVFETAKKAVDDAQASFDKTAAAYKLGTKTAEDMRAAQRNLTEAQTNAAAVQKDYGEKIRTTQNIIMGLSATLNKAQEDHAKLADEFQKEKPGVTWQQVVDAQKKVVDTTEELKVATKSLDDIFKESTGGVSKYAMSTDDMIRRMKGNIDTSKTAGDVHKDLAKATKLAKEAYEALFVEFENGVGSVEKLSAAWEKWQALQKKLHPEQFASALDKQAKDEAQSIKEGIALQEANKKSIVEAGHALAQFSATMAKARDGIKDYTESIGPMKRVWEQAVQALQRAGKQVEQVNDDLKIGEDIWDQVDEAADNLAAAYKNVSIAAANYAKELKAGGMTGYYADNKEAIDELIVTLSKLGVGLNSVNAANLVSQLKKAEAALQTLNALEAKTGVANPQARLALEVDIASKKLEIRRQNGEELNQVELDQLRDAKANLERFKGDYLSSMEEIFKWGGVTESPFAKLEADARHAHDALLLMEEKLRNGIYVSAYEQTAIKKNELEKQIKLADAAGEHVTGEQRRQLEKMKQDLEKFGGHYKTVWQKILDGTKQVLSQLGSVFARAFSDMAQNMIFGSDFNKQLEEQANDLRGSLADQAKEWEAYVAGVNDKIAEITLSHEQELATQLQDLSDELAEATGVYEAYVASVKDQISTIQETHRNELGVEVSDLWNAFHQKQEAFEAYEKEIREKQARITEDANRNLERQLTDLHQNLRDRQESFDDFIYDSNKKLSDIGKDMGKDLAEVFTDMQRDLAEIFSDAQKDLEDQQRETSEKKSDMELDYNRDVEDLNEDLKDAQKKGDLKQVAEIKKRLARRVEDHQRAMKRLIEDDARKQAEIKAKEEKAAKEVKERGEKQTREITERAAEQTAAIKLEIDRRTRDHNQYVAETIAKEGEIIADYERNLGRQIQELEDNLTERATAMTGYWTQLGLDLDAATAKHKAEEEKQTGKLLEELANRTREYNGFVISNGAQREAITEKHRIEAEAETAKVVAEFALRLAAYEQFNNDVQLKLDALVGKHRTALDEITGLFNTLFMAAVDGFLQMAAKSLWDEIGRQIKLHWGSLLGDLMDTLGGWVKDAAKAIGGVFGIGGSSGGGPKIPSAPLPVPGGETSPVPGSPDPTGGIASAAGSGVAGLISLGAGVVSAVSGVIGNFQMAHMNTALGRIEESTRYMKDYMLQMVERGINLFLAELPGIGKAMGVIVKDHIWRIHDIWGALTSPTGTNQLLTDANYNLRSIFLQFTEGQRLKNIEAAIGSTNVYLGDISRMLRNYVGGAETGELAPAPVEVTAGDTDKVAASAVDVRWKEGLDALLKGHEFLGTIISHMEGMLGYLGDILGAVRGLSVTAPAPAATSVTVAPAPVNVAPAQVRVAAAPVNVAPTPVNVVAADVQAPGVISILWAEGLDALELLAEVQSKGFQYLEGIITQLDAVNGFLGGILGAVQKLGLMPTPAVNVPAAQNNVTVAPATVNVGAPVLPPVNTDAGTVMEVRPIDLTQPPAGHVGTAPEMPEFLMIRWDEGLIALQAIQASVVNLEKMAALESNVLDMRWADGLATLQDMRDLQLVNNDYLQQLTSLRDTMPEQKEQNLKVTLTSNTVLKTDGRVLADASVKSIQSMGVRG